MCIVLVINIKMGCQEYLVRGAVALFAVRQRLVSIHGNICIVMKTCAFLI